MGRGWLSPGGLAPPLLSEAHGRLKMRSVSQKMWLMRKLWPNQLMIKTLEQTQLLFIILECSDLSRRN
jgi:hypothetical protein